MNSQDLKNLIDYVMTNNSWKNLSATENRKMPKYLDFQVFFTLDRREDIITEQIQKNNDLKDTISSLNDLNRNLIKENKKLKGCDINEY